MHPAFKARDFRTPWFRHMAIQCDLADERCSLLAKKAPGTSLVGALWQARPQDLGVREAPSFSADGGTRGFPTPSRAAAASESGAQQLLTLCPAEEYAKSHG